MTTAARPAQTRDPGAGVRKVTYSLPADLVAELDRRTAEAAKSKSAVVAAALALYFAERDRAVGIEKIRLITLN